MKNRDIVLRTRPLIMGLTYNQVKNLTRQQVIDNIDPPFTDDELAKLDKWFNHCKKYFTRQWIERQHLEAKRDIITDI